MSALAVRPGDLPAIVSGNRRGSFARLLANGLVQAGATISLPFAIAAQSAQPTLTGIATLLGLAALLTAAKAVEFVDAERLGLDYTAEVRLTVLDGLLSDQVRMRHGAAMSRLVNDLSALKNWVGLGLARLVVSVMALAGCLLAAALVSLPLLFALLVPVAAIGVVSAVSIAPLRRREGEVRRRRGRLAARLGETLLAADTLRAFGQVRRSRRRVGAAALELVGAQIRRMRLSGMLRAIPEAILPVSVVLAVAASLAGPSTAVSIALLAGLAADPIRKMLRAIEYRAAFVIARERLRPAMIGTPKPSTRVDKDDAAADPPGLKLLKGPREIMLGRTPKDALLISSRSALLAGSLRRNIDIARRLRNKDSQIADIAADCQLDRPEFAPQGLDTWFREDDPRMTEALSARLALARALSAGARRICVDAPVLLTDAEGCAMLKALPASYPVTLYVLVGDAPTL